MYSLIKRIKGDNILIACIFSLTIIVVVSALGLITTSINYFGIIIHFAYGQASQMNSNSNSNNNNTITNSLDLHNIPAKKVHVGDIDIGYKTFGKGDPILLIAGGSADMNSWDPSTVKSLSSNHTVIVFDNRGVANTTSGSKPFSMKQFANDTAGLMDALKIQKANILGHSLGSNIAEQFAITYPEKVERLILASSSCGGKEGIPKPPQFLKLQTEVTNKSLNNIPITQEEIKTLLTASYGPGWIRLHPEYGKNFPTAQEVFSSVSPNTIKGQDNAGKSWEATNWNGACDELAKIAKPTLIITGTDDNFYAPHANSLILAGKIPGAWLVQIKDAGHAVLGQYPDTISKVLQTFLLTTTP